MAEKGTRSLVAFKIDSEEFALDIASVQEINRCSELTRVPNASHYVHGVMNLRGKIIPVVDLRSLLGFHPKNADKQSRMIVIETCLLNLQKMLGREGGTGASALVGELPGVT